MTSIGFTTIPTSALVELEMKYPKEVYEAAVKSGRELNGVVKDMLKPEILQKMGVDIKMPCDDKEFLDYFNQLFSKIFGWGVVEVWKDGKGEIVGKRAIVKNNGIAEFILKRYGKQDKPTCQWIRGMAGGAIAEARSWKKFKCRETKCIAMGDSHCELIVEKID